MGKTPIQETSIPADSAAAASPESRMPEHRGHPRLLEFCLLLALGFAGWVLCAPVLPIPSDKHLRAVTIALIESAIIVGLGCLAARRVGLAPTASRRWWELGGASPGLREVILAGVAAGIVSVAGTEAAGVIVVRLLWSPSMAGAASHAGANAQAGKEVIKLLKTHPLAVGVGFPIIEEIHFRLLIMTALAWLIGKLFRERMGARGAKVWWTALVVQGFAFAAMHALSGESPLWWEPRIVQVMLDPRVVAGVVLGYAYWRWGLESSIIAHVLTNVSVFLLSMMRGL